MTAESLAPQMAAMSKLPERRHEVAVWGAASDRTAVARAMYEDTTLDLRPGLSAITAPMTLVHPDYTPLGAPAGAVDATYRAAYAPARTVVVKEAAQSAHFVMFDNPAAFDAELDAFLAQK